MPDRTFFPWASVLRFGLGHLRLTPDAFWRLSLPELHALLGTSEVPATSTRQELEELMVLFPDRPAKPHATNCKGP
jgi:uncharacterized phage protein (TIGR02216 family)